MIGTREDPPLPLPRLRARSQIVEIRQRDLRFTAEEAATFLRETMGLALSGQAIGTLQARTEGWPTGLQLAALALHSTPEQAEQFIAAFAGDDRYVMDYLLTKRWIVCPRRCGCSYAQTAVLDRFTAGLCDVSPAATIAGRSSRRWRPATCSSSRLTTAVNGIATTSSSQMCCVWRSIASPRHELHRRAAHWHWSQGMAEQAIQHALAAARTTGDYTQVDAWIGAATMPTLAQGGLATVRSWLDAVPEQRICADPNLALAKGWLLAMGGDLARTKPYAALAQAAAQSQAPGAMLRAQSLSLSSWIALLAQQEYRSAIDQADQALAILPGDQGYWRLIALWIKAESTERIGPMSQAIEAYRAAQAAGRSLATMSSWRRWRWPGRRAEPAWPAPRGDPGARRRSRATPMRWGGSRRLPLPS